MKITFSFFFNKNERKFMCKARIFVSLIFSNKFQTFFVPFLIEMSFLNLFRLFLKKEFTSISWGKKGLDLYFRLFESLNNFFSSNAFDSAIVSISLKKLILEKDFEIKFDDCLIWFYRSQFSFVKFKLIHKMLWDMSLFSSMEGKKFNGFP